MNAGLWCKALLIAVCMMSIFGSKTAGAQSLPSEPATQASGTISGTVLDEFGAVIQNAQVAARSLQTANALTTRSDEAGKFSLAGLPFGNYELDVTAVGFAKYVMRIELSKDLSVAPHDATLRAGKIDITVHVHVADEGRETVECVVCGYTYFSLPVKSLPLYDRDPQSLVNLQAGVVEAPSPDVGAGKNVFSISGGRPATKTILIDGFDDRNPITGNAVATISLDSVEEFNSDYYADNSRVGSTYGQTRSPQVSTATRAGSNSLHGEALWYAGRSGMDSNGFFTNRAGLGRDHLRYDQFFGSLGGPISLPGLFDGRDHAFFFASFEHTRDNEATGQQVIGPLPSFLESIAGAEGRLFKQTFAPSLPLLGSPVASPGLNGVGDFGVLANSAGMHNLGMTRLSVSATDKISIEGRFLLDQSFRQSDLNNGAFTPSSPLTSGSRAGLVGINAMVVASPNVVNSARLGYQWSRTAISGGGSDSVQLVAVNSPLDIGAGLPEFPARTDHRAFLAADTVSFVRGPHSLNASVQLTRRSESYVTGGLTGGRIYYSDLLALATDGAMSTVDPAHAIVQVEVGVPSRDQYRPTDLYAFATDSWRPSPRSVVSYGLGYFFYSGAGYDGASVSKRNFAPTLSFAWAPTNSESIILRGGSSILYAPPVSIPYAEALSSPLYPVASGGALSDFIGSPLPRGWIGQTVEIDRSFAGQIHPAYTESSFLALQKSAGRLLIVEAEYQNSLAHHLTRYYRDGAVPGSVGGAAPATPGGFLIASDGNSAYHSLQVRATSRERRGLVFQAHYTLSKSLDSVSADRPDIYESLTPAPVYGNQPGLDRGPSDFDRRHRVVGFFLWRGAEAPRLPRPLAAVFSRWELSGIITYQSGPFVSLYSGGDLYGGRGDFNQDGILNDRLAFLGTGPLSSAMSGGTASGISGRTGPADGYFNSSFFGPPGSGRVALGRNVLAAPAFASFDLAVQKSFRFADRQRLEFRAEAFNLTNQVDFQPPVTNLVSADFGRSRAAGNPRIIRAAVRYSF